MYFLASERWEHGHSPCLRIQRTHVEGRLDASEMFACSGFPAGRKPASPELAGSERQAGTQCAPGVRTASLQGGVRHEPVRTLPARQSICCGLPP